MWQPPERIKHSLPVVQWPSAEEASQSMLFSPIDLGRLKLSSRTWIPAMVPWRATEEGFVTDDVIDWYARFAQGQPGAIVVEATGIRDVPSGPLMRAGHERFIPGLKKLADAVREASEGKTKLFIQLIDFLQIRRRPEREKFLRRFLQLGEHHYAGMKELGQSFDDESALRQALIELPDDKLRTILNQREWEDLQQGYRERVWDTHLPHIEALPQQLPGLFSEAAKNVIEAGFDGVELHFAHAYTMASFLSARNCRNDQYGGSLENRVRLPLEVLDAVRATIGQSPLLGLRFLGEEVIEGGSSLEDALYFAKCFASRDIDFLSLSKGGKFEDAKQPRVGKAAYPYTGPSGYECMPSVYSDKKGPFARNVYLASEVKKVLSEIKSTIPIVTAGGIGNFEQAEKILQAGDADIIGAARQAIADPDWLRKTRLGFGSEVRRCEYTNYCEGLDQNHKQVTCKLWDRKNLDEEGVKRDHSGKRRLTAPAWEPSDV